MALGGRGGSGKAPLGGRGPPPLPGVWEHQEWRSLHWLSEQPWVGVPPIKQRGRLQPREVRERGTLRLGRSGRQALPLPPVTEAAPPVTMPEGWTITWSRRQDLS